MHHCPTKGRIDFTAWKGILAMDSFLILHVFWAWVCVGNVLYFTIRWYLYKQRPMPPDNYDIRCVAVFEAVKGEGKEYAGHVRTLIHQDHTCYRLIFCLSDSADPAFRFLSDFFHLREKAHCDHYHVSRSRLSDLKLGSAGLKSVDIALAGRAKNCTQKIYNNNRGYQLLNPGDKILAWVDADTQISTTWLKDLIRPVLGKDRAAVTGYRCIVPENNDWTSAFVSVINASILTLLGDTWRNCLWGGSMAMTRQVFTELKIPAYVIKSFSDDVAMAALLKKNHVPIYFSFNVIPQNRVRYSFSNMFRFARRQYMYPRFYYKFFTFIAGFFLTAFIVHFYLILVIFLLHPKGIHAFLFPALMTAIVLRGGIRFHFIRNCLKVNQYTLKCLFLETFGTPLVHLLHFCIWLSSLIHPKVEWAGITYKIKAPFNVEIS